MGDVYRLVSDLLVEDTPADRRKIDLTTPFAGMNHQRDSSEHRSPANSRLFPTPMPASSKVNTESRTEATGMKGFLRLCRER
ncbi:PREDICTED: uncharacterized protein LOC108570524, partial [Habropoda laboriosa]|uniref:uncharacterized protein LOC108570524 n=1 Tax=Habropoda laboriosa TaxID=597456 RepID=UPI00083CCDBE